MKYNNVVSGVFIDRPNRFVAHVDIGGIVCSVHVKNTGRCKELLVPGCTVYLSVADNTERKTKYDLIAVEKKCGLSGSILVNIDSQAPNTAAEEWLRSGALFGGDTVIRREVKYGSSRFDFYIEYGGKKAFLEVKGVTLEAGGIARFPDAPTERGIKHLNELVSCIKEGFEAYVLFVIQMKGIHVFRPNDDTHRAFGDALRSAERAGVHIIAVDCTVTPDTLSIDDKVLVELM